MWSWVGRGDGKKQFLNRVLKGIRLDGGAPLPETITGSPCAEIDPASLVHAVREQVASMPDPQELVFQCRVTSLTTHVYAALRDVTPSEESAAKMQVNPAQLLEAATSPRAFLAEWLLSFPLTASLEYFAKDETIIRLMKADPVAAQRFRAWHVKESGKRTVVKELLSVDTLPEVMSAKIPEVTGGAVVIGFAVRACWDVKGLSHAIMGTVLHYRVVDLTGPKPLVYEVRCSLGGGSLASGLPDILMASEMWKQQSETIECLLAKAELYEVLGQLDAAPDVHQKLDLLERYKSRFANYSIPIFLLNIGALPYRFLQRYLPSAREGDRIGGRYVIKNEWLLQRLGLVRFAE